MKTRMIYEAFDGQTFDNADACKTYEATHVETRLVGLTPDQVRSAITREDPDLADAFEKVGSRIAKARIEAGELRRGRKAAAEQETQTEAETPAPPASADPLQEALRRAKAAGRAAWERKEGAVVPALFAGTRPLHDAWLEGWREGQTEVAVLKAAGQPRALADAEG